MTELEHFLVVYSFRRRADRLVARIANKIADIRYACTHDEIVALATSTTVHPCISIVFDLPFIDNNRGGFLFMYWLIHMSEKWVISSLHDALKVKHSS